MKILVNNSNLDPLTVTYGELKAHLPSTSGQKLPTAAALEEEGNVYFTVLEGGTLVTVYGSGFLAFTQPDEMSHLRTTVYAVDRCRQLVYRFFCSDEEYEDQWEAPEGCNVGYCFEKGRIIKLHILPEEAYAAFHWLYPVSHICEERLVRNGERRERKRLAVSGGGKAPAREPVAEDFAEVWIEAEAEAEQSKRELELLEKAKAVLTEVQRKTVELYFREDGTTEREVARVLGTSHQNVHVNLTAALKKMRKVFAENGCQRRGEM